MRIETNHIIIRDFQRKDEENLYRIVREKYGFELFQKRMPIGHKQPNMESDSYFYYRRYRI